MKDPVARTNSPYTDPSVKGPRSQLLTNRPSSAAANMLVNTVNKTGLHPGGIAPQIDHTELEEELHEKAHIDYTRVAIIPNPSVAALYEDALVYETGTAITSSGALTAYSGKKTGRSPLDKRIVKEPTSENDIWWGPVNKPMDPEVRAPYSCHFPSPLAHQPGSPILAVGWFRGSLVTRTTSMISLASHFGDCIKTQGQLLKDVTVLGIGHMVRPLGQADAAMVRLGDVQRHHCCVVLLPRPAGPLSLSSSCSPAGPPPFPGSRSPVSRFAPQNPKSRGPLILTTMLTTRAAYRSGRSTVSAPSTTSTREIASTS
jgi:hypothetical protein